MVKIFVGNVTSSTTEEELRKLFETYGTVSDCDILQNYGFVHMDEEEGARKAVAALHKHELNGSRLTVQYATTKVRNATKIYVGNVPEGVTAAKVRELFQPYGKVVECDVVKNYAFVHMQRENEALEAISQLNHTKLDDQKIFVSLSRSNPGKNGRGDGYLPPPPPPPPSPVPTTSSLPPPPPPRDMYERGLRHDPYAAAAAPRYFERDPYDRRIPPPQRPISPAMSPRYYRERSPMGNRRSLLPPPPTSAPFNRNSAGAVPPPPPPPPPPASSAMPASAHYQRYSLATGFDKDDYFDDKYSNGFNRAY
uniref:RNA-binding protein 14 n=1 Tax=Denticeps clupeoides TaxID=299321 RepID=A0AAY4A4X9_9TELE